MLEVTVQCSYFVFLLFLFDISTFSCFHCGCCISFLLCRLVWNLFVVIFLSFAVTSASYLFYWTVFYHLIIIAVVIIVYCVSFLLCECAMCEGAQCSVDIPRNKQ